MTSPTPLQRRVSIPVTILRYTKNASPAAVLRGTASISYVPAETIQVLQTIPTSDEALSVGLDLTHRVFKLRYTGSVHISALDRIQIGDEVFEVSGFPRSSVSPDGRKLVTTIMVDKFGDQAAVVVPTLPASTPEAPTFDESETSLPDNIAGQDYQASILWNGDLPITFTATGLPDGFSIDPDNGDITGTSTETFATTVTVTATNAAGSASQDFTFHGIQPPPPPGASPVLNNTASSLPDATVNNVYTYQAQVSGNPPFAFTTTALPSGLGFDGDHGVISGTPSGVFDTTVTITVTNAYGSDSHTYAFHGGT